MSGNRIGLAFDLRDDYGSLENLPNDYYGEFDTNETIQSVEGTLRKLGYQVEKIGNIKKLVEFIQNKNEVDLVFNIAEGFGGRSRESQVPCLLEAYGIPYTFSDPLTLALSLDKKVAKMILKYGGIPTPDYFVIEYEYQLKKIAHTEISWPSFVKPAYEGTSKGIDVGSIVFTEKELIERVRWLLATYQQPVIVEEYLPGKEYTTGIIGTGFEAKVLGSLEITVIDQSNVYGFLQKEECETRVQYAPIKSESLNERLSRIALDTYLLFDCRDAGRVDIKLDKQGEPKVIEINPLAGLHPTHSDLPMIATNADLPYEELLKAILKSAFKRVI